MTHLYFYRRLLWIFFGFFLPLYPLFAQIPDIGTPILRYWNPETYDAHSQNWSIAQDKQGRMYFANTNGILVYQGLSWNLIPATNQSAIKSVATDKKGKVYVGAVNDFGYLKPDSLGLLTYQTLTHLLPDSIQGFKDIWDIHCIGDTTYFRSSVCLFRLVNEQIISIFPKKRFHRSYQVDDQVYITDLGQGLMRVVDDALELLPQGDFFANRRIYSLLPHPSGKLLVCTEKEGLGLLNPLTGEWKFLDRPKTNSFLVEKLVYRGVPITRGRYAFGTVAGILITDANGNWEQLINKSQGLENEDILSLNIDNDGALWAGLNNGISRIETNIPLFIYDESHGLSGVTYSIEKRPNTLFAGGSQGLFAMPLYVQGNFEKIDIGNTSSIWDMLDVEHINGYDLWIASSNGLFLYSNGIPKMVRASASAMFALERSTLFPQKMYIGMSSGFAVMDLATQKFDCYYDSLPYKVRSIAESKNGDLWLGTAYNGFVKVSPKKSYDFTELEIIRYDTLKGLESLGNNYLFKIDQYPLLFGSRGGLYEYDESTDRLVKSDVFGSQLHGMLESPAIIAQGINEIWFFGLYNHENRLGRLHKDKWEDTAFQRLQFKSIYDLLATKDSSLWAVLSTGIAHYHPNKQEKIAPFEALITSITTTNDSLIYGGYYIKEHPSIKLAYQANLSISLYFAATSYAIPEKTIYSYQLDGYDNGWSEWAMANKKEYTGLAPGTYTFKVKAKNIYGIVSQEASLVINISSPWYMTPFAYLLYFVLVVLFIWGLIRLNVRRLLKEKERLEVIVANRTAEVMQKNAELEQQQEEISTQSENLKEANKAIMLRNQKITASITYAQRIQRAVQVPPSALKECIPDSFILLKPKDIVSGDFFWLAEIDDKLIIVLADCTGHGVPGAFMSMIGQMILKEAVIMHELCRPAEILEALDSMLRSSLRQESTQTRDGMDMSICVIDRSAKVLKFAGAKRPLFYIKNGEGIQVKGDKHPIGGKERQMGEHTAFHEQEIAIDTLNPITCYMYSDGFPDQFGGPDNRKFMSKRFKDLLVDIHQEPMDTQEQILLENLKDWQGYHTQLDDIMVVGFVV